MTTRLQKAIDENASITVLKSGSQSLVFSGGKIQSGGESVQENYSNGGINQITLQRSSLGEVILPWMGLTTGENE